MPGSRITLACYWALNFVTEDLSWLNQLKIIAYLVLYFVSQWGEICHARPSLPVVSDINPAPPNPGPVGLHDTAAILKKMFECEYRVKI